MRMSYIQVRQGDNWVLVPKDQVAPREPSGPYIMPDLEPYQSPIDKSVITSRSHHRAHMKAHDVIEVGNERMKTHRKELSRSERREDIARTLYQMGAID